MKNKLELAASMLPNGRVVGNAITFSSVTNSTYVIKQKDDGTWTTSEPRHPKKSTKALDKVLSIMGNK